MRFVNLLFVVLCISSILSFGCDDKSGTSPDSKKIAVPSAKQADEGFNRNTNPKVTFIELGSVRCIPCIMMQSVMREIEEEFGDQVRIIFYDVWTPEGKPYGAKYRIRAIPTQVFLDSDGKEYFRHEGFFAKEELAKVLQMKGAR